MFFFFFSSRRRHTRCLSDWSSDVCSSDLRQFLPHEGPHRLAKGLLLVSEAEVHRPPLLVLFVRDDSLTTRSEERRVGKECRSRWSPDPAKQNRQNEDVKEIEQLQIHIIE